MNNINEKFYPFSSFEALSCLTDRGWHDTWSDTYFIPESELIEIKNLLEAE
jgi:hypothetical protein